MVGGFDAWNDRVDHVRVDLFELHRAGRRGSSITTTLLLLKARPQHSLCAGLAGGFRVGVLMPGLIGGSGFDIMPSIVS